MTAPRIVIALGGNALLRRGEQAKAETQRHNVHDAAAALAGLAGEYELVVTHGNGPQVGLLALEADAYKGVPPYPLDVLGAESQGMIGYLLTQALQNELPGRAVVAVLTQVAVAAADPAFFRPSKPIGPVYSAREARAIGIEHGWAMAHDGSYVRRVVASPMPTEIVEADSIELLLGSGAVVVCAGGGGIPVVREAGGVRGVEAVIDKDLTAALLAETLGASRLVLATDVPYVERDWHTPAASRIETATSAELRRSSFAAGSMGPKVEAACRFVERTGGSCGIGALSELAALVRGDAGTQIVSRRPVLATR
ncbi:MAG TPA: carbamate kinase [Gaiellaceae bacterium]|jgi:carbamate kinase|nr:carbamate kinase [Gaiellaceae bacterium]